MEEKTNMTRMSMAPPGGITTYIVSPLKHFYICSDTPRRCHAHARYTRRYLLEILFYIINFICAQATSTLSKNSSAMISAFTGA